MATFITPAVPLLAFSSGETQSDMLEHALQTMVAARRLAPLSAFVSSARARALAFLFLHPSRSNDKGRRLLRSDGDHDSQLFLGYGSKTLVPTFFS